MSSPLNKSLRRTQQLGSHLRGLHLDPSSAMSTAPDSRPRCILMIHGFTQYGHLFRAKVRALEKHLEKAKTAAPKQGHLSQYPGGVGFSHPTGPIQLLPSQIPGFDISAAQGVETDAWAWWRITGGQEPYTDVVMEKGIARVAEMLVAEGPFDGVMGSSQGGALAGLVASLLEPGRLEAFQQAKKKGGMPFPTSLLKKGSDGKEEVIHPPMEFAVSYSGFGISTRPLYAAFYDPKIQTPLLHFLGSVDTVVSEERSMKLVHACASGQGAKRGVAGAVTHPGVHSVPARNKQYARASIAFIREALNGSVPKQSKEQSVEDMDLPF